MKAAKCILIMGSIVAFFLVCLVSYAEDVPEGIIFVDQSGSVKKHDAKLKSRALLIAFLRTFKKPYRIVLAGFNEEIHEYVSIVTETEADMEVLAGEIQKINARSYSTDLEIPFKYLLERDGKEAVEFVLIISDGEPDIWDGKLRHFSKRVKSDPRYEDLNRQYRMLKASGLSPDELFDRLRHLYHKRNLELIEEQMSRLRDGLGDRIILWDLSGESGYLRSLAEKCGAQYLPMKTEQTLTPVDLLRYGTLSLLTRSSRIAREPPPQDRETGLESALPADIEPKPEIGIEQRLAGVHTTVTSQPPSSDLGDEPKKPAEQTPKQISRDGGDGWAIAAVLAFFVLAGVGCTIVFCRLRKRALRAERKKELEAELEGEIGSIRERRLSELEAELSAEKQKKMQELEAEIGRMKEERLSELEAEVAGEIGSIRERRLAELESEVSAEKEKRMREFEAELSEYWKSVEQEVEAEKEKIKGRA
ncbi:MAG TPA: hypothetical protein HPP41_00055 [Deltaproteobacteria bacterium]|nr:hypothetical protein [Deltaproteobacteria bacterium]